VECKVRATKVMLGGDPSVPAEFTDYRIMDSGATSNLSDGDYELLANGKRIRMRLEGGQFLRRL
jgi:hypothetical protein